MIIIWRHFLPSHGLRLDSETPFCNLPPELQGGHWKRGVFTNLHRQHQNKKLHHPEKMHRLPGRWPTFTSYTSPFSTANNTIRNSPADCFQSSRTYFLQGEPHGREKWKIKAKEQSYFKLKHDAGKWMAEAKWEAQQKAFPEHAFYLCRPQEYFALVPNFQSCSATAKNSTPLLHLT